MEKNSIISISTFLILFFYKKSSIRIMYVYFIFLKGVMFLEQTCLQVKYSESRNATIIMLLEKFRRLMKWSFNNRMSSGDKFNHEFLENTFFPQYCE